MVSAALMTLAAPVSILFLGNSHTAVNDVPGLVQSQLKSSGVQTTVASRIGGQLDAVNTQEVHRLIRSGKLTHLVLQGQMISMSHKYDYSIDAAVALANSAESARVTTILYSEWPRKGIAETDYIEGIYRKIAARSKATISPVGRAWDKATQAGTRLDLWAGDGNHAAPAGSYVAAVALARTIAGPEFAPTFVPSWLKPDQGAALTKAALSVFPPEK